MRLREGPRTGKRVARINAVDAREIAEVPHLRIIDDALWERVKARQQEVRIEMGTRRPRQRPQPGAPPPVPAERPDGLRLLRRRATRSSARTATAAPRVARRAPAANATAIARQEIEARVLAGLKERPDGAGTRRGLRDRVQQPRSGARPGSRERARGRGARRSPTPSARSPASCAPSRTAPTPRPLRTGSLRSRRRRPRPRRGLHRWQCRPPIAPASRPAGTLPDQGQALGRGAERRPNTATEAGEILRTLIDRIVLTPSDGGLRAELYGDLAAITAMAEGRASESPDPGSGSGLLSVVAGRGFEPRPSGYEPDELPGCSTPREVSGAVVTGFEGVLGWGLCCSRGARAPLARPEILLRKTPVLSRARAPLARPEILLRKTPVLSRCEGTAGAAGDFAAQNSRALAVRGHRWRGRRFCCAKTRIFCCAKVL